MKKILQLIQWPVIIYICISSIGWQVRHPKANEMTCITHFWGMITWQLVEEFR